MVLLQHFMDLLLFLRQQLFLRLLDAAPRVSALHVKRRPEQFLWARPLTLPLMPRAFSEAESRTEESPTPTSSCLVRRCSAPSSLVNTVGTSASLRDLHLSRFALALFVLSSAPSVSPVVTFVIGFWAVARMHPQWHHSHSAGSFPRADGEEFRGDFVSSAGFGHGVRSAPTGSGEVCRRKRGPCVLFLSALPCEMADRAISPVTLLFRWRTERLEAKAGSF